MIDQFAIWSEIYDQVYADVSDDIDFYVHQSKLANGPILELGCGTGRITIPLLKNGYDISGLDSSKSMMQVLQRKTSHINESATGAFVVGNMVNVGKSFDRKFKLVIAPYRGFQSLLTLPEQQECLAGLRNVLDKEHKVIINLFTPTSEIFNQNPRKMYKVKEITDSVSAVTRSVWHRTEVCLTKQTLRVEIKVETSKNGFISETRYAPFSLRYTYPQEAEYLFHYCGYEIIDLMGDYNGNSYNDPSQDMIWMIRKQEKRHVRV